MKRKDGIRLKIKWNRVFTPRQIFYGIQYIPNKFYDCSEAVGNVIMFIALIICLPFICLFYIFYFPIRVMRFLYRVKRFPKDGIENNRNFAYFFEVIEEGETNND